LITFQTNQDKNDNLKNNQLYFAHCITLNLSLRSYNVKMDQCASTSKGMSWFHIWKCQRWKTV